MSYFEIRKAVSEEDAVAVSKLAREIWTECYTPIIGTPQVEYMLENIQSPEKIYEKMKSTDDYYMAYLYGRLIGYMAISPEEDTILLSKLYIEKDFRGRKIADQFMNLLRDEAKRLHKKAVQLTVNKQNLKSIAIYQTMGFSIAREQVTDIGEGFVMDDYVMTMKL